MQTKLVVLLVAAAFVVVAAPTASAGPTDDPVGYTKDVVDWLIPPEGGECIENPIPGEPQICWQP